MLTMPSALPALLALATLTACASGASQSSSDDGWRSLFDGESMAGWSNPYDWGSVSVVDGEIRLVGDRKFFIVTDEEFEDFVFEGEVMLPDTMSNAGFMFRANVEENRVYGYQAEVDPKSRRWSGGLYDEGRRGWLVPRSDNEASGAAFRKGPGTAFRPTEWNQYRIQAVGDSLKIWVNDVLTVAYRDSVDAAGPIGLQHHGEDGKVYRYRNLRIRELP